VATKGEPQKCSQWMPRTVPLHKSCSCLLSRMDFRLQVDTLAYKCDSKYTKTSWCKSTEEGVWSFVPRHLLWAAII